MQRMAGLRSDKSHEGELGPPIAITKCVNGVEHTQELSCLDGEVIRGEVAEILIAPKLGEGLLQLAINVFGIAERVSLPAHPQSAVLAGPGVDILEEVMMDGPVMPDTKQASRHRFIEPLGCDGGLEPGERGLTFQVSEVLEDLGAGITVVVVDGIIRRHESAIFRIS